jgi:hypothetical protein
MPSAAYYDNAGSKVTCKKQNTSQSGGNTYENCRRQKPEGTRTHSQAGIQNQEGSVTASSHTK